MITYNEVYDIVRKEKYNEVLQQLPKNFLEDVSVFLKEQRDLAMNESDFFAESSIKAKKQLENSISLFRELMRLRKKKILNLTFVATETGIMKRDFENLLSFEKEIFDILVKSFEENNKELTNLINGKKEQEKSKYKMVIFNQNIEQFVDMFGNITGPYSAGQLVNLNSEVAELFVSSKKADFADE
ncbi:MAG: hypothetical protein Q8L29_00520 [archaeon]|nr:hypothetical protein [archaeon]